MGSLSTISQLKFLRTGEVVPKILYLWYLTCCKEILWITNEHIRLLFSTIFLIRSFNGPCVRIRDAYKAYEWVSGNTSEIASKDVWEEVFSVQKNSLLLLGSLQSSPSWEINSRDRIASISQMILISDCYGVMELLKNIPKELGVLLSKALFWLW